MTSKEEYCCPDLDIRVHNFMGIHTFIIQPGHIRGGELGAGRVKNFFLCSLPEGMKKN